MCLSRVCPTETDSFLIKNLLLLPNSNSRHKRCYCLLIVVFTLFNFYSWDLVCLSWNSSLGKRDVMCCLVNAVLFVEHDFTDCWLPFHDDPLTVAQRRRVGHACHINRDIKLHVSLYHEAKPRLVWIYRSLIASVWWCSRIVPPRCHLCQTPVHVTVNRPEKSP